MTCSICQAPADHLYAEGDLLVAMCDECDRAGAEDAPMESARSVYLTGAFVVLVALAWLIVVAS